MTVPVGYQKVSERRIEPSDPDVARLMTLANRLAAHEADRCADCGHLSDYHDPRSDGYEVCEFAGCMCMNFRAKDGVPA